MSFNGHNTEALDKFVPDYLQYIPSVLDGYIKNKILYHVFVQKFAIQATAIGLKK
jgi:hypothetical protein